MKTSAACHANAAPVAGTVSATAYNHPLLTAAPVANAGCKCGKLRPPRKLHTAVGLWLALFVAAHFAICLTGVTPGNYDGTVGRVRQAMASLPGAVLLLILFPMLVQAGSGIYLMAKEGMQYDVKRCDRGGKLRYFLQRWSGLAMLVFLLTHVVAMRGWGRSSVVVPKGAEFAHTAAAFHPWGVHPSNMAAANSMLIVLLLAGVLGTVYHIANGAWSGAILWKVVESPRGKAWMGYACVGLGVALAAMGAVGWYAFTLSANVQAAVAAITH